MPPAPESQRRKDDQSGEQKSGAEETEMGDERREVVDGPTEGEGHGHGRPVQHLVAST